MQENMNKEWTKIERKVHNFKENPEFVGTLKGKVANDFDGYDFVFDVKGQEWTVFGKTAIMNKLKDVSSGSDVKIVYLGEEKSKKNPKYSYENYDVFVK